MLVRRPLDTRDTEMEVTMRYALFAASVLLAAVAVAPTAMAGTMRWEPTGHQNTTSSSSTWEGTIERHADLRGGEASCYPCGG
jgi:hypothetical protein